MKSRSRGHVELTSGPRDSSVQKWYPTIHKLKDKATRIEYMVYDTVYVNICKLIDLKSYNYIHYVWND